MGFFLFALWWDGYSVFQESTHPWFCEWMGAPDGASLLYSTLTPLYGVASYLVLRMIGPVGVYNAWYILSIALLPLFTIFIVRELRGSRTGAALAAVILFYPAFLIAHRSHLNIASLWWVGCVFWCYLRAWRSRRWFWFAMLGFALAGVFYVSAYHTIHAVLLVAVDVVRRVWIRRRDLPGVLRKTIVVTWVAAVVVGTVVLSVAEKMGATIVIAALVILVVVTLMLMRERRCLRAFLVKGAIAAALFGTLVAPFFLVAKLDTRQDTARVAMSVVSKAYWSAQPLGYLLPAGWIDRLTEVGRFGGGDLLRLNGQGEFAIFPGYVVWLLVGIAIWRTRRRKQGWYWLGYAGVFALLSFGPFLRWGKEVNAPFFASGLISLPAQVFDHLPFLEGYRVFVRMGLIVQIALAIFVGLSWPKKQSRTWLVVAAAAAVLVMAEHVRLPTAVVRIGVPKVYETVAKLPVDAILAEFPAGRGIYLYPLTLHHHRLANQYVSRNQADRMDKERENLFLWFLKVFDHPHPHQVPAPIRPPSPEGMRADFDRLGIDAAIVHYSEVKIRERARVRRIFEHDLGLAKVESSENVVLYVNPRRDKGAIDNDSRSSE